MPTNEFIGFASSGNANILTQAEYTAAAEQGYGVQPGMASSRLANKVWRQGANMAAAIGGFILDQGFDALDNGDIDALKSNIKNAFLAGSTIETGIWTPTLYGGTNAGTITNTANNSFYIKISRLVFLRFIFSWKITAAPTGDVMISGVPYVFDSFYPGFAGSNNHICNLAQSTGENVTTLRLRSYTPSTSQLSNITWSTGSNTYNVWNNAVNSTDTTLGWLLYRTNS